MTTKQKLHFGTKRQRAAARHALSARRKPAKRHNAAPRRKQARKRTQAAFHRPRAKRNIGEVVYVLGAAGNPARRRKQMATSTKKSRRAGSHKQRNAAKRRSPCRSNPGGRVMTYVTAGASVVGGAVGSKVLTQLVLQGKNTGAMGYAGNIGATVGLGWLAHMFFRDKSISTMAVAGGIAQLIVRVLTDQTPYGTAFSGAGLGDYQVGWNFLTPQRVAPGYPPMSLSATNNPWCAAAPTAVVPTAVVTHSAAGKAGVGSWGDHN